MSFIVLNRQVEEWVDFCASTVFRYIIIIIIIIIVITIIIITTIKPFSQISPFLE